MPLHRTRMIVAAVVLGTALPALTYAQIKPPLSPRATQPKSEAVAETRLLMEGIAQPNFNGLGKMLKGKPEDGEAWNFTRGQALLIAETGNLLLLRPPRTQGQDAWNRSAIELREAATRLARTAASQDLNTSRARLVEVANACNRCHQNFGVQVKLNPFISEKPVPNVP